MPSNVERHRRFTIGLAPAKAHLSRGEVRDLRSDVEEAFERLASDVDFDMLSRFKMSRVLGSLKDVHKKLLNLTSKVRSNDSLVTSTISKVTKQQNLLRQVMSSLREIKENLAKLSSQNSLAADAVSAASELRDLQLTSSLREAKESIARLSLRNKVSEALWSGTAVLSLNSIDFTVTAASLNAAAAGTLKSSFTLSVKTLQGEKLFFLSGNVPSFTPAEAVTDAEVGVPAVTGTPELLNGVVTVEITFDTDAGVTKTYAADDEVSVACDLTVAGIALPQVTATWTVE